MISLVLLLLQTEADYWTVENFPLPEGEVIEVGGMDFGPDEALWLSTRRGQLWRVVSPLGSDPTAARSSRRGRRSHRPWQTPSTPSRGDASRP